MRPRPVIPSPRRIIFLGTPAIAVPSLEALVKAGESIVGVVTQPDRPAGRGRAPTPPPVKVAAERLGLAVLQPPTLRRAEVVRQLRELRPDLIVIAAFGQMLRPVVLELPPLGCVNLHPSLLPKLRGTSPINWAILEGLTETGVTVMVVDEVMDSGPILAQETEPIQARDTAESLGKRLAERGADLLARTVDAWATGMVEPRSQDHSQATFTRRLQREDGRIDWGQPAAEIERRVRAFHPWPGAHTQWRGELVKIHRSRLVGDGEAERSTGEPGEVLELASSDGGSLAVATGKGVLLVDELQLEGRRSVSAAEFARGYPSIVGSRLG